MLRLNHNLHPSDISLAGFQRHKSGRLSTRQQELLVLLTFYFASHPRSLLLSLQYRNKFLSHKNGKVIDLKFVPEKEN